MNETVSSLLADATGIDESEISPELNRNQDDRWDSISHLRLITALEENFSIKFTMEQIEQINSVSEIEELLAKGTG